MNKNRESSLEAILEQLEELVPILQNSIDLLRKEIGNKNRRKLDRHSIRVAMPDWGVICKKKASDTLIAVIEKLGVEKIYRLGIGKRKRPLISDSPRSSHYRPSGEYHILTGSNTDEKIQHLIEIKNRLGIRMNIKDRRLK